MKVITLDIGGANIKIFDGKYRSYYFPIWKKMSKFGNFISSLNLKADIFGITMTAEIADCFKDKKEGVNFIIDNVEKALNGKIKFLSNNLNFEMLSLDDARKNPYLVASTNFIATAKYISEREDSGIIIDIGSTTTDIIPFKDKKILSCNNDLERLQNCQLIYSGILRTNVCAIIHSLNFRKKRQRISAEYFSITADVYRILGQIDENQYTTETPDGRGKDLESCKRRLARIICSDINEINDSEIYYIAKQIKRKQICELKKCIKYNEKKFNINNKFILGIGKFLGKDINACSKYQTLSAVEALYHILKN